MTIVPIDITTDNDVVVARFRGDIDISNRTAAVSQILAAVDNEATGVILDLAEVRYLDSAGVSMIFDLARQLEPCRQRLGVALAEDSPLRTLFKITSVHEVVALCTSVNQCAAALRDARD